MKKIFPLVTLSVLASTSLVQAKFNLYVLQNEHDPINVVQGVNARLVKLDEKAAKKDPKHQGLFDNEKAALVNLFRTQLGEKIYSKVEELIKGSVSPLPPTPVLFSNELLLGVNQRVQHETDKAEREYGEAMLSYARLVSLYEKPDQTAVVKATQAYGQAYSARKAQFYVPPKAGEDEKRTISWLKRKKDDKAAAKMGFEGAPVSKKMIGEILPKAPLNFDKFHFEGNELKYGELTFINSSNFRIEDITLTLDAESNDIVLKAKDDGYYPYNVNWILAFYKEKAIHLQKQDNRDIRVELNDLSFDPKTLKNDLKFFCFHPDKFDGTYGPSFTEIKLPWDNSSMFGDKVEIVETARHFEGALSMGEKGEVLNMGKAVELKETTHGDYQADYVGDNILSIKGTAKHWNSGDNEKSQGFVAALYKSKVVGVLKIGETENKHYGDTRAPGPLNASFEGQFYLYNLDGAFDPNQVSVMVLTTRSLYDMEKGSNWHYFYNHLSDCRHSVKFSEALPDGVGLEGCDDAEHWGRWSLGNQLKLTFPHALPEKFSVDLHACAFGDNIGKGFKATVGNEVQTFQILWEAKVNTLVFDQNLGGANSIVIDIPHPTSPDGGNKKLGIGLIDLKIRKK